MAKAKTPTPRKASPRKTASKPTAAAAKPNPVDEAVDAGLRTATPNMQSGMEPGPPSDVRAQQVRNQFANADELAAPNEEQRAKLEDQRVAQQVRGF